MIAHAERFAPAQGDHRLIRHGPPAASGLDQTRLDISLGQYSSRGNKPENRDFYGAILPEDRVRASKGIALVVADGISSSEVSGVAAQTAVKSFLSDYYCTADSWSVDKAARRVIAAVNAWLHAETRRGGMIADRDRGYVCTFSALILRSRTAHVFHVGDSSILHLSKGALEPLTDPHRIRLSAGKTCLARALGMNDGVDVDYRQRPVALGDIFILATDGVSDVLDHQDILSLLQPGCDLDLAARALSEKALQKGSDDNLTVQLARIEALPSPDGEEALGEPGLPPLPAIPEPGGQLDGFAIIRRLHASDRSHVFEARDLETGERVALKVPAVSVREDGVFLRRFLMEEWIARRLDNPHLLRPAGTGRPHRALYTTMQWIEGESLAAWMRDNPRPSLSAVRRIISQAGQGLLAMHRRGMLHQDLRPDNILIDRSGHVTIIDFGSAWITGGGELFDLVEDRLPGTQAFMAPEYSLGDNATERADLYALATIAYQMLSGRLPYGTAMAQARTRAGQRRLAYDPVCDSKSEIPLYVDAALRKALHYDPQRRQSDIGEFLADLHRPNPSLPGLRQTALIERDPAIFWKGVSLFLAILLLGLLGWVSLHHT
ncbi:bifunctional protein-serine/threonine kinase/phosphatase [Rhizobium sp. SSA_523]|uniref:bifunctional protein-serine/threonine kinase/phosphatase n=1 Tax=Rhizobium sp. SSA_523 TaxID=2952477 RepID=UPI0020911158|nr:bifunctional protein-serine/threonine kinase/phosphatase [Rhizobium sp. SSA_523]MCO5731674.1 bifunctional protein-serine/threonine kinase/phosphatase [Rhizobium sp. SSA_523]WKC22949.1 bifunctional protein-serine/threonine kinase/phosphatase [Rhizobium sp. SSA_523]